MLSAAVVCTSSFAALAAARRQRLGLAGGDGLRGAASARGEEVQNQTPAITTAETTLASIRPNALRIVTIPTQLTTTFQAH